jgi:hypothetical protein
MNTFASNALTVVVLPSLLVTGFLYGVHKTIRGLTSERPIGAPKATLLAILVGGYFLGHPNYSAVVPLIRAPTEWLFAAGGVYVTLGSVSLAYSRDRRLSGLGAWLLVILCIPVGLLVANRFELGALVHLFRANTFGAAASVSLSLGLMYRLGYSHHDGRRQTVPFLSFAFASYTLILANSIPLSEQIRGPVGIVFVAYGCIGVLLGIPLYVLGTALVSSSDD